MSFLNNLIQNQQNPQMSHVTQQVQQCSIPTNSNIIPLHDFMKPLDDPQYLLQNAHCFQRIRELSQIPFKEKSKKNETFIFTSQFLYGTHMPPYYSVLSFALMEKLVTHLRNPLAPAAKLLTSYNELIDQERELFDHWLSNIWEENLKNRRLIVIPHVEEYIKSAYNFSNSYIKSHYNGMYTSKMKIDYNREECEKEYNIEMVHCQTVKKSDMSCTVNLPKVDITDIDSKISFKDCVYNTPQKSPCTSREMSSRVLIYSCKHSIYRDRNLNVKFSTLKWWIQYFCLHRTHNVTFMEKMLCYSYLPEYCLVIKDELCHALMKEHCSDISMCLSSVKHIMSLEKPNSVWLIPVNIKTDTDNRKEVYIGGALSTGHFSQQEKSLYYLRKELKRKFRELNPVDENIEKQNHSQYNYNKWKLNVKEINGDVKKSLNILIRNKPQIRILKKSENSEKNESVFMPKVEYQPEFGYEKLCEEQLIEYWQDTYIRNPKTKLTLVSVQYNMDIMMIKNNLNVQNYCKDLEGVKQMRLQRLYLTLEKLLQLDTGEYVLLHNPKKPFQVEVYQLSTYGGFNLLNMYYVLQQSDVSDSLAWNPVDPLMVCPIHEHFKVAPCMFRPNPVVLDVQTIHNQATKFKTVLETQEKIEKERVAKRMKIKKEKNRVKQKLKRENDNLYQMKRKALNK